MRIFINTAALKSRNDACYHCFSTHSTVIDRNRYLFYLYFRVYIYNFQVFCLVSHSMTLQEKTKESSSHAFLKKGWMEPTWIQEIWMAFHTEPALWKTWLHQKTPKLRMALNVTEHGLFLLFHIQALMVHCGKTTVNSAGWLNWDRY